MAPKGHRKEHTVAEISNALKLDEFISLNREIAELEAELKSKKQRRTELDEFIRENVMLPSGINSLKRDDATLSIRVDTRASLKGDKEEAYAALIRAGAGEIVGTTVNSSSLASFVRARLNQIDDPSLSFEEQVVLALGPDLAGYVAAYQIPKIQVTLR